MKFIVETLFWIWFIGLLFYGCSTKDFASGTVWPYAAVKKLDNNQ